MKRLGITLGFITGMMTAIGTKAVNAKPMTRQEYNDFRGWQLPENENGADEGYLVEYQGSEPNTTEYQGYVSWSPKYQFEQAYEDVKGGLSFGHAVELLKGGHRVARQGWNGKGMFLFVVKGATVTEAIEDCYGDPAKKGVHTALDAIYMHTVQGNLVPWLASQTDMLSEDWQVVNT